MLITMLCRAAEAKEIVRLSALTESPQVQFAIGDIQQALRSRGHESGNHPLSAVSKYADGRKIILANIHDEAAQKIIRSERVGGIDTLQNEGFIIHKSRDGKTIIILGSTEAGLMYGGLEAAELITIRGIDSIRNQFQNPYMKVRGTKFNIPLDMRSPTYTEPSDAAQKNMAEMWNMDFWKEYIDNLARYRYNLISLWNMHPFPSMVKVP